MTLVGSEVLGRPAQKTPSSTHPLFTYLSYPFIWPDHLHPRPCPGHPLPGLCSFAGLLPATTQCSCPLMPLQAHPGTQPRRVTSGPAGGDH